MLIGVDWQKDDGTSGSQVTLFKRGHIPAHLDEEGNNGTNQADEEKGSPDTISPSIIEKRESESISIPACQDVLTWQK